MQILAIRERLRALAARYTLSLREPALQADLKGLVTIRSVHPGSDGSARLLVELSDGQTVESVRLLRGGVCVSTQIGCMIKAPNCSPRQHAAPNQRS